MSKESGIPLVHIKAPVITLEKYPIGELLFVLLSIYASLCFEEIRLLMTPYYPFTSKQAEGFSLMCATLITYVSLALAQL